MAKKPLKIDVFCDDFAWDDFISENRNYHIGSPFRNRFMSRQLIKKISKYGLKVRDKNGNQLFQYINRCFINSDALEVMFHHGLTITLSRRKGKFFDNYITPFFKCFTSSAYIGCFVVLLKYDHEGIYARLKYHQMITYAIRNQKTYLIPRNMTFFDYVRLYWSTKIIAGEISTFSYEWLCGAFLLMDNHEKRHFTLFEMMLPLIEKSDKKGRFQ